MHPITIRPETPADYDSVYTITAAAFDTSSEADLNNMLRAADAALISLVAEHDGTVVGHIMFSAATLVDDNGATVHDTVALGPIAITPTLQRQGIGSQLIRAGLDACRAAGYPHVFLIGHPEYYPRFGFQQAHALGFNWVRPIRSEVFMCIELNRGTLAQMSGIMRFHPAFDAV